MFQPPPDMRDSESIQKHFDQAQEKQLLEYNYIWKFLKINPNLQLSDNSLFEIMLEKGKIYIDKIPSDRLPHFLMTYHESLENNPTKYFIFYSLYVSSLRKYPEMTVLHPYLKTINKSTICKKLYEIINDENWLKLN